MQTDFSAKASSKPYDCNFTFNGPLIGRCMRFLIWRIIDRTDLVEVGFDETFFSKSVQGIANGCVVIGRCQHYVDVDTFILGYISLADDNKDHRALRSVVIVWKVHGLVLVVIGEKNRIYGACLRGTCATIKGFKRENHPETGCDLAHWPAIAFKTPQFGALGGLKLNNISFKVLTRAGQRSKPRAIRANVRLAGSG